MITPEQAKEALRLLEQAAWQSKISMDMLREQAIMLYDFIAQVEQKPQVNVVYAFKLKREDGLYMDRSFWNKSGKTYNKRNHMNAGIFWHIESEINKNRPRYYFYENGKNTINPNYDNEYREYESKKQDINWRAGFIPEDWIIECIPMNTESPIIRMSARDFYTGKEIQNV